MVPSLWWFLTFITISFTTCCSQNLNPVIPNTVDSDFIAFENDVQIKQVELAIPTLYGTPQKYKEGFEQYKKSGAVSDTAPTGEIDADFRSFQKFMKQYSRTYNSMDEFTVRYSLFLNVLNSHKGYNDGNDMAGINRLSDRTTAEKRAQYG